MIKIVRGRSRDAAAQKVVLDHLRRLHSDYMPAVLASVQCNSLSEKDFRPLPKDEESVAAVAAVREALYQDQYRKCCYCERHPDTGQLEHFRPKTSAKLWPLHRKRLGYYWLAWTWENLLYACSACNRCKSIQFPLAHGCTPLTPDALPPGSEHPLLLDPGDGHTDPFACIRFHPVEEGNRTRWKPFPRNGSIHGQSTIEKLSLDGPRLLDRYDTHIKLMVTPAIQDIRQAEGRARSTSDTTRLRQVWRRRLDWLCDPEQQFIALSCDVIDHHFPRMFRRRWELHDPRPDYARIAAR